LKKQLKLNLKKNRKKNDRTRAVWCNCCFCCRRNQFFHKLDSGCRKYSAPISATDTKRRDVKNQKSMKNLILIVLSLFLSQTVISQEISKEEVCGTWKIQKITPLTDPKLKDLINGFKQASFKFNANGILELKSANTSKLFLMITNRLKNAV
jgi:hypothetical protein